jgi:hypothetical protein
MNDITTQTINIPGQLSPRLNTEKLQAEVNKLKAQRAEWDVKYSQQKNNSLINNYMNTSNNFDFDQWVEGMGTADNPFSYPQGYQPYSQPIDMNKAIYAPPVSINRDDEYQKLKDLLMNKTPLDKRTDFEKLVDGIFSNTEKEQFLLDLGYELEWDNQDGSYDIYRTLADGTRKTIANRFNDLFMKEMLTKFKITLLTKPTLKMKF